MRGGGVFLSQLPLAYSQEPGRLCMPSTTQPSTSPGKAGITKSGVRARYSTTTLRPQPHRRFLPPRKSYKHECIHSGQGLLRLAPEQQGRKCRRRAYRHSNAPSKDPVISLARSLNFLSPVSQPFRPSKPHSNDPVQTGRAQPSRRPKYTTQLDSHHVMPFKPPHQPRSRPHVCAVGA